MSTVPSTESSSAPTPPVAKQVPTERTYHGDTVTDPYAWLADPKDPEVIALPGGGERLHGGADGGARRAAVGRVRRDQGAHPGDRPVGAGAQGELVALLAHRGGPAVLDQCRRAGARRRGHAADAGGRQAARRRGGAARRERARRGQGVLLARRVLGVAGREAARLLHRLHRGRAVHAAGQGPRHRGDPRGRGAQHLLRRGLVARRFCPVLRHGGRRVAAVPGMAAHCRDADDGRRGGVRGERREVLARRRDVPGRAVAR